MAWNPDNYKKSLIVENHGTRRQPKYSLTGFVRITHPDGNTYLEPLANDLYWKNLVFDEIVHVEPQGTDRTPNAGELNLIRRSAAGPYKGREA